VSTTALKCTVVVLIVSVGLAAYADPYATEIVSSGGFVEGYEQAASALGSPTLSLYDPWSDAHIDISMVYGPWTADTIVSLAPGGHLTIRFDSPVTDDPDHWYGADFIIFGNAAFTGAGGWVEHDTDMATYYINDTGAAFGVDAMTVSVSDDGAVWHTFTDPLAGGYWPTQAYAAWDAGSGAWDHSSVSDFTKPMDPNLEPSDFGGLSVVEALDLYAGSGGGTAFDIGALGLDSITYVRVEGPGVIDAFAKVGVVPEPATAALLVIGGVALLLRRRRGG